MIALSIIIPHFNIPELLVRCLGSIPVRSDVQVIVVDDCSPGAEKYNEIYPELNRPYLEFYTTSRGGSAGRARNVGLEYARGEWLFFADADDFFSDSFQSILDRCSDEEADIIYFRANSVKSDDVTRRSDREGMNNRKIDHYLKTGEEDTLRYFHGSAWPLLIRRRLVLDKGIRFHETEYSNDTYFTCCCGYHASVIKVDRSVVYTVTERSGSLYSKPLWKVGKEESEIRMNELVQSSIFVYQHTGKLNDVLFSRVFLTWLENPKVAVETVRTIKREFGLSYLGIAVRVFSSVLVKGFDAIVSGLR